MLSLSGDVDVGEQDAQPLVVVQTGGTRWKARLAGGKNCQCAANFNATTPWTSSSATHVLEVKHSSTEGNALEKRQVPCHAAHASS